MVNIETRAWAYGGLPIWFCSAPGEHSCCEVHQIGFLPRLEWRSGYAARRSACSGGAVAEGGGEPLATIVGCDVGEEAAAGRSTPTAPPPPV